MQPNFYAIIPATVRYDNDIIPNAKLLYGEISAMCGKEGYCWAENAYFAELYNVSNSTISRWISQLEKANHIKTELNKLEGNSRKIFISVSAKNLVTKSARPIDEKRKRVVTKSARPIDEKRKSIYDNNTINNTSIIERSALAFFKENFPSQYELFLMKYQKQIKDFAHFEKVLELKLEEEETRFEQRPINARIERFAINYIKSDDKEKVISLQQEQQISRPDLKRLN